MNIRPYSEISKDPNASALERETSLLREWNTSLRQIEAMQAAIKEAHGKLTELNALRWIPITERLPTIEDGNEFEDVEWSDGKSIREGNYKNSKGETHWRRITLP